MGNNITHFATFGSSQLGFQTELNPMRVALALPGATENELRAELNKAPFDNRYCTTYPIEEFERMAKDYGMVMYDLKDVRSLDVSR